MRIPKKVKDSIINLHGFCRLTNSTIKEVVVKTGKQISFGGVSVPFQTKKWKLFRAEYTGDDVAVRR